MSQGYSRKGLNLFYLWSLLDRASSEIKFRAGDDVGLRHFADEMSGAAEVVLEVVHAERDRAGSPPVRITARALEEARQDPRHRRLADAARVYWNRVRPR